MENFYFPLKNKLKCHRHFPQNSSCLLGLLVSPGRFYFSSIGSLKVYSLICNTTLKGLTEFRLFSSGIAVYFHIIEVHIATFVF